MTETQNRQMCCSCGIKPPRNSANEEETSTVLSTRFGWRVVRRSEESGASVIEWRCPACWELYKANRVSINPEPNRRRA
jgi:hypothetical protein